jgi:hypothetical protein
LLRNDEGRECNAEEHGEELSAISDQHF